MTKAGLHLIPVPISGGNLSSLSPMAIEAARKVQHFVVERAKSARAFLKLIEHPTALNLIEVFEIPPKEEAQFYYEMVLLLKKGIPLGVLSEAGLPCVADPGFELVAMAHKHQIPVYPYPGPNSILLALMASGFNGQEFHFHGYLPAKKEELRHKLIWILNEIRKSNASHIFMETPYRNKQVLDLVVTHIPKEMKLCIAADLTGPEQIIETKSIKSWTTESFNKYYGKPCMYLLSN